MGFYFGGRCRSLGTSGEKPPQPDRLTGVMNISEPLGIDVGDIEFLRLLAHLASCGIDAAAPPLLAVR